MAEPQPPLSRRTRLRAQTIEEIRERAFALVDAHGPQAVSLAAIAKGMGMSAPALYRYFDARHALMAELVRAACAELASALEEARADSARRGAAAQLRATVAAYRGWALGHPRRYALIFGEGTPATSTALRPAVEPLFAAVYALGGEGDPSPQLRRLAIVTWTRLHGAVAFEIAGLFAELGFDAGLLLDAEVGAALQASRSPARTGGP